MLVAAEILLFGGSKRNWGNELILLVGLVEGFHTYFSLKAQNCWLMTCQTISSDAILVRKIMCWMRWRGIEFLQLMYSEFREQYLRTYLKFQSTSETNSYLVTWLQL
jgi:hypothetical protein